MKKLCFLIAIFAIVCSAEAQIKIANNGKVGIGHNNPVYTLDLKGTARFAIHGQGWDDIYLDANNQWGNPQLYCKTANFILGTSNYPMEGVTVNHLYVRYIHALSSDERLKENVKPLESTLSKLSKIAGKSYNYKRNEDISEKTIPYFETIREKGTFGFIAQELEKVFPELVYAPDSANEYYSINYIGMIPVLVEAIKEQQTQIEYLQKMLSECCSSKSNHKSIDNEDGAINEIQEKERMIDEVQKGKLYGNIPNPFSVNTEIKFEIPSDAVSAQLMICNLNGAELKSYNLTQKGLGSVIIQGSEFAAGIYLYTLLVNNQIVDTKKMVLTK